MVRGYVLAAILTALIGTAVQFFTGKTIDLFYHDAYIVLAPLHIALAGATLFGVFAGASVLFEKRTGRRLSGVLGYLHLSVTALSFVALFAAGWLVASYSPVPHPSGVFSAGWIVLSVAIYAVLPAQVLFPVNLAWNWWKGWHDRRA